MLILVKIIKVEPRDPRESVEAIANSSRGSRRENCLSPQFIDPQIAAMKTLFLLWAVLGLPGISGQSGTKL
jgi:hypothetical protein